MPVLRNIYLLISLPLVLILSGCSSLKTQDPVYSAAVVSRADLLSGRLLFAGKAGKIILPEDHVIELDDKMQAYLERYVPRHYADSIQVRSLVRMMLGQGTLGMEYDMTKTHTAREAFRKSEGNCLAFSYLFVAFARERGLKISFQEVEIPPQWDHIEGELYSFSRHVNIRVHMRASRDYVVDIDRINYKPHYRVWKISDKSAIALYYSNKGTDYLVENDLENAFRYLVKGLELSPRDPAIWSNLGVLYRMQGMYDYAERAYFIALKLDGRQRTVLSNLSVLYQYMGDEQKAEYYFRLAKEHRMKNPYYRYHKALEAFEERDYNLAVDHLKAALKSRGDVYKFHSLLVESYGRLGDQIRANEARAKARKLQYP